MKFGDAIFGEAMGDPVGDRVGQFRCKAVGCALLQLWVGECEVINDSGKESGRALPENDVERVA
jgi:hypothetical protein